MQSSHLIGIAGPSCAGKSELARWLSQALKAPVFTLDSYYPDLAHLTYEERCRINFDEPAALDHELIRAHLADLASGKPVDKPVYDFTRHTRAAKVEHVVPGEFVVVEGLFALHWEDVRQLLRTKVYVGVPDEMCFQRRLERDVRERGRTPESVRRQYDTTVRPMAELHIHPTRIHADVEVSGDVPLESSGETVLDWIRRHRSPREGT